MKKVTFYLKEEQITALNKIAEGKESDISKQIRKAIDEYIERSKRYE